MSRGRRLNSNSSCSVFSGFSSSSAVAGSGSVIVATDTLSPKFCFMNSVILDFSSSGEGNGGGDGGFCAMSKPTSRQSRFVAMFRLQSDPYARRLLRAFSCAKKSREGPAQYPASLRDKASAIEMEIERNIDELGKKNGRTGVATQKRRTNNVSFRCAENACSHAHRSSSGHSISGILALAHPATHSLRVRSSQRRNPPATSNCTKRRSN